MIAGMSVGHDGSDDGEADALRFAKQRDKNERGENRALQKNGNGQRAALHAAFARELLRITVDQASTQRSKTFFGAYF